MSLQQRDKLTMKAEGGAEGGCQPGEAAESGGAVMAARRQPGEVPHVLRQKGTLGL